MKHRQKNKSVTNILEMFLMFTNIVKISLLYNIDLNYVQVNFCHTDSACKTVYHSKSIGR